VIVVEWADKIAPLLPEARLSLMLAVLEETDADLAEEAPRTLSARAVGARYATLLENLNALPEIEPLLRLSV